MDSTITVTTIPALFLRDLVCIQDDYARPADRGIVFEIVKVNPRNWNINPINGDGSALRCPPELTALNIWSVRSFWVDLIL